MDFIERVEKDDAKKTLSKYQRFKFDDIDVAVAQRD
jgi:hypothetical protein